MGFSTTYGDTSPIQTILHLIEGDTWEAALEWDFGSSTLRGFSRGRIPFNFSFPS
jgi:hypothetical protein